MTVWPLSSTLRLCCGGLHHTFRGPYLALSNFSCVAEDKWLLCQNKQTKLQWYNTCSFDCLFMYSTRWLSVIILVHVQILCTLQFSRGQLHSLPLWCHLVQNQSQQAIYSHADRDVTARSVVMWRYKKKKKKSSCLSKLTFKKFLERQQNDTVFEPG